MITKLKFAKGNAKLEKDTAIFSLPAGHTCAGALQCLSASHRTTGKLTDGPQTVFRCYAATGENLFKNIRVSRWRNYDLLKGKSVGEMSELINRSLPRKGIKLVRVHSSGDFFNQDYFDAWLIVARKNPGLIFYAYTKMLPLWVRRQTCIPANFKLVASRGGKFDSLIEKHNLRSVTVVYTVAEARKRKLQIDHDDTLAWKGTRSFALLLHGTQPAGSLAGKALYKLRKAKLGGYKADYFAHYGDNGNQVFTAKKIRPLSQAA